MDILTFENVSFTYALGERPALRDINLSFAESGFYLICGPSGSGKSTLLRMMKKNLIPGGDLSGSVAYMGTEISEMDNLSCAAEIGFVQQNPAEAIVTDVVWHELAFGLENLGLPNEVMRRRVAEMAAFFGIESWYDKPTGELSGGQQQMLNLASVMVMQPKVLLLDEPTSQLDPLAAGEFLQMLARINRELGTTVILTEHRLEELFAMADRICVLENGQVSVFDKPRQTAQWYLRRSAETGRPVFEGLPAALRIACGREDFQGKRSLPLTVRDGRLWMAEQMKRERGDGGGQWRKNGCANGSAANLPAGKEKRSGKLQKECKRVFGKSREDRDNPILACRHIAFSYKEGEQQVLRDVTFSVKEGEWFGIFGQNGAGKSTLLQILCQNLRQQDGEVRLFGKRTEGSGGDFLGYGKMVLLPQDPKALFTEITVKEELMEALEPVALPEGAMEEAERERLAVEMMERLELVGCAKQHPYDLSGGQQQRLALGKLLLLRPKILLLDEPTKGLDPEGKTALGELLSQLCGEGMTIVTVSHDIEFCSRFARRCGMLFHGEMTGVGEIHDFFRGNYFFTTAANRIAKAWFPDAITCEEVLEQWAKADCAKEEERL